MEVTSPVIVRLEIEPDSPKVRIAACPVAVVVRFIPLIFLLLPSSEACSGVTPLAASILNSVSVKSRFSVNLRNLPWNDSVITSM